MAYTVPTLVGGPNLRSGQSVLINTVTATGAQDPFQFAPTFGNYLSQVTFQVVPVGGLTALVADLEVDMTSTDANFAKAFNNVDLFANPVGIYNLNGGNIRYRWSVDTLTDGTAEIWVICG